MALDFPSSPTNGQTYGNYYYDATVGAWNSFSSTVNTIPSTLKNLSVTTDDVGITPFTVKSSTGTTVTSIDNSGVISANSISLVNDLTVANGGTGAGTFTTGSYLKGNGTSAIQAQTGIPFADVTMQSIGAAADLNTYVTQGLYHQSSNVNAAGGTNYPAAYAGLLEVFQSGVDGSGFTYQRYTTYQSQFAVYTRSKYTTTWTAWQQIPIGTVTVAEGGTGATTRSAAGLAPVVASATARDTLIPSPVQGDSVWRSDKGYIERYRAAYNVSTNPGGMVVAGWYPDGPITARFWIPDHTANPSGSFTMTLDTAKSSPLASNLFSISGAIVTLRNPGVYAIWYRVRSAAVASGTRAFFGVQMSDLFLNGTSTLVDAGFRTSIENSFEDSDHVSAVYTANSAGVTATFSTYSSVSALYNAGIAAITYLGPVS